MKIRPTTLADLDRVMDILAGGRRSLAELGIDQWQNGYPPRELIEDDVARGESYVVEDEGGDVVGCAALVFGGEACYDRIEGGSWLTESDSAAPRYAAIHRVAVARELRRGGVARFLVGRLEELSRACGFESVRIDTHPGNAPMRGLVEALGYTYCGITFIGHAEGATRERVSYEKLL